MWRPLFDVSWSRPPLQNFQIRIQYTSSTLLDDNAFDNIYRHKIQRKCEHYKW